MVNVSVKYNSGCAYMNGIFVMAEGPAFQNRGCCCWWEIIPSGNLSSVKKILVGWLSGS
jgi:hypothetical protein